MERIGMTLMELIEREMTSYRAARSAGERETAWLALERVHILSQTSFWLHIRTHMVMLGYAIKVHDGREIAGQLMRLVLAPLGNLTGRLPIGNTGRSNVSAFASMPISDDLQNEIMGHFPPIE
jgi:hypothetical protein